MTKQQAIQIHSLIYAIGHDIPNKTPKVDKLLKQIKKGLRKLPRADYELNAHSTHNAWETARHSIITKDEVMNTKIGELYMALYNAIDEKYQNIYYTDKTFSAMINSFESHHKTYEDDEELNYTHNARDLANAFLKEIGVEVKSKLSTRATIIKQNLIIERKIA